MFHILNVVYVFNIILSLSRVYLVFRVMFRISLIFINLYCVLNCGSYFVFRFVISYFNLHFVF